MRLRALSAYAHAIERVRAVDRVGNVRLVVGRVEVLAIPAAAIVIIIVSVIIVKRERRSKGRVEIGKVDAYVGYRTLDRIPWHGLLGSSSESRLGSAQGARSSPPQFGPV